MNSIELRKTSHKKISSFSSYEFGMVAVIFIIYFSVKGKAKSTSMGKIALVFDQVITKSETSAIKSYVAPWFINKKLKHLILILLRDGYINFKIQSNSIRYSLSDSGEAFIESIMSDELFTELSCAIKEKCEGVNENLVINYSLLVG